jgi:hypothetical protein
MANQIYSRDALRSGITVKPGQSTSFTVKALATVAEYDAVGGPPSSGVDQNGNSFGPTEPGEYIIVGLWKHTSQSEWKLSKIEWGTPLRENTGSLEVFVKGAWKPLIQFTSVTKSELKEMYESYYKKTGLPTTWLFNDFGHITCFIAKDLNHDGKWESNTEKIHHQFFHSTPKDEGLSSQGKANEIELKISHGCIHIKPGDMDKMISKGYMKKGNMVYIHDYGTRPLGPNEIETAQPPFSLHFFPGMKKLFAKGQK